MKNIIQYRCLGFIITWTLMFLVTPTIAQNYPNYFKSVPESKINDPTWVQLMYSSNPNVFEVQKLYYNYYTTHKFEKSIHTQNYKHWLHQIEDLVTKDGFIEDIESVVYKERMAMIKDKHKNTVSNKSSIWNSAGPFDTTNPGYMAHANVYCIEAAPSNTNIVYCGTEPGLLFKSTDKGLNWSCISLDQQFANIYDIKVHPTNPDIVYFNSATKIYKSINGGTTWSLVHTATGNVEQFYIHKTEPSKVYAATANGLLYSADSGATWSTLFNKRCWDIEGHPTNPDIIYLSVNNNTQKRSEIYKSINKGVTWTLKDNNWYTPANIAQASDLGCKIGVTPADPNRIYAALIGDSKAGDNGWIGIYYSLDGGDSWVNADGTDGGPYVAGSDKTTNWYVAGYSNGYHQGWYNFDMDVSHTNADRLWIGTIWSCESGNKGQNIEYVRGTRSLKMHPDVQDIDVIGNEIWYTSDGGINYSDDEMQTVSVRNKGIFASEFWGFGQGWNEDVWTGGRYHNGNATFHENYGSGNATYMGGAEASTGYINPFENKKMYYSDTHDKLLTGNYSAPYFTSITNLTKYPYETPYLFDVSELNHDPRYANHFYIGRDNMFYKSTDGGQSYNTLYTFNTGAKVHEFEISRSNSDVIYCAVRENNSTTIYKTTNGGTSFTAITAVPSDSQNRIDLTLSPSNPDDLWVSSYHGSNGKKVYRTTDGGASWNNMTTTALDGEKIQDIVFQYGTADVVYVATTQNVYYWDSTTSNWVTYSTGLPAVFNPRKILPFYRDGKMRMATNKGIWEAPLAKPSLPLAQPMIEDKEIYCKRDTIQFNDYSVLKHAGATWEWTFNPAPSYIDNVNARSPKVVFSNTGSYDVTLKVTDAGGNSNTKTVSQMITLNTDYCSPEPLPQKAFKTSADSHYLTSTSTNEANIANFTFTGWIKPTGTQSDYSQVFALGTTASGNAFCLGFREGNNTLGIHWRSNYWWYDSNLEVPADKWSFIAMVVTPTEIKLYLNEKSHTWAITNTPFSFSKMTLCSFYGWGGRGYKGEVDEFTFWRKALSDSEIRLSRHLTKSFLSDPDLIAYYQFNNLQTGIIHDKKGLRHLKNNNAGAILVNSDAPVGPGVSNSLTVNAGGTKSFGSSNCEMVFNGTGTYPNGELVVSKININPSLLPSTNTIDFTYWIINNYGTNSTFDALSSIKFSGINNINNAGGATNIQLFKRQSNNGYSDNWTELLMAPTLDNANNASSFANTGQINSFSQFYIGSKITLGVEENIDTKISIYPNPVQPEEYLTFNSAKVLESFKLFDISGKQIMFTRNITNQKLKLPQLEEGLYLYQVKTINKTHHGKLIIKK